MCKASANSWWARLRRLLRPQDARLDESLPVFRWELWLLNRQSDADGGPAAPEQRAARLEHWAETLESWASTSKIDPKGLKAQAKALREQADRLRQLPSRPVREDREPSIQPKSSWARTALGLLQQAERAADNRQHELGWRCLTAARRAALFGLRRPELRTRARAARREAADKLQGWRKETIEDALLDEDGKLRADLSHDNVFYANVILDGHHDNVYHRLRLMRRTMCFVSISAWVAVGLAVWFGPGYFSIESRAGLPPRAFPLLLVLFGVMGAVFSGFLSARDSSEGKRIPAQLAEYSMLFARPGVAALSALVTFALLKAGVIKLGDLTAHLALFAAFASGFSERLVVGAVAKATPK